MAFSLMPFASLSVQYQEMLCLAKETSTKAYAPYSQYNVGAVLLHPDGTMTAGANWENCTYQATCAERCAIVSANVKGQRQALAVAVYAQSAVPNTTKPKSVVTPCGLCRQMLEEVSQLSGRSLDVIVCTADMTEAAVSPLTTYLPSSFGPADVGVNIQKWSKLSQISHIEIDAVLLPDGVPGSPRALKKAASTTKGEGGVPLLTLPAPAKRRSSLVPDQSNDETLLRERLIKFYQKYNPERMSTIDSIVELYVGNESDLFESLVEKYGPEP